MAPALAGVDKAMRSVSVTDDHLGQLADDQLYLTGKRLRAALTLDAFGTATAGPPTTEAQWAAAAVELVHEASLIHDDVTDQDEERRGQSSAWMAYGEDCALLLGDHFLACAFDAASRSGRPPELVRELAGAVRKAAAGQSADAAVAPITAVNDLIADYESRVQAKSGALMALPVVAGYLVSGADAGRIRAVRDAWHALGAAYQIGDDLAELEGRKTGRTRQSDLAQHRFSAPVVHWLDQAQPDEAAAMWAFLGRSVTSHADILSWRQRLLDSDAPARCRAHQSGLLGAARAAVAGLAYGERCLLERAIERVGCTDTNAFYRCVIS